MDHECYLSIFHYPYKINLISKIGHQMRETGCQLKEKYMAWNSFTNETLKE